MAESTAPEAALTDDTLDRALQEGCGGFSIGRLALALPMGALREVVPMAPEAVHDLPSRAAGLVGALDLRGVLVPVLDLRLTLGRQDALVSHPCVVIMVHGGCLLGLLADRVTGMFSVAAGSFKPMLVARGEPTLLAGSMRRADDGQLVNLLRPQALASLPDMPMVIDPEPERGRGNEAGHASAARPDRVPMMLVSAAGHCFGLDAMDVHATLAAPTIEHSALARGMCRGVVTYRNEKVPVVDLLACLKLRHLSPAGAQELLLLPCDQGLIGLLVDRVIDVVGVSADSVVPIPGFALARPELIRGALAGGNWATDANGPAQLNQCLVLDSLALRQDEELSALACTTQAAPASGFSRLGSATDPGASLPPGQRAMVTFELAGEAAVPLEQLAEILPYTTSDCQGSGQGRPLLGLVVDRGRSIPVISLPNLTASGDLPPGSPASLLVLRAGEDWVGFAVEQLRNIEMADWTPSLPPQGMGPQDLLTHCLQSRELAQVGQGHARRMLRVLDLQSMALAMQNRQLTV